MAQKSEKEVTVVATFDVTYGETTETVKTHEKAWVATHENSPASAHFVGWKRKD